VPDTCSEVGYEPLAENVPLALSVLPVRRASTVPLSEITAITPSRPMAALL
jgi:hypothetical protein